MQGIVKIVSLFAVVQAVDHDPEKIDPEVESIFKWNNYKNKELPDTLYLAPIREVGKPDGPPLPFDRNTKPTEVWAMGEIFYKSPFGTAEVVEEVTTEKETQKTLRAALQLVDGLN